MTPETEAKLFNELANISAKIDRLQATVDGHTIQIAEVKGSDFHAGDVATINRSEVHGDNGSTPTEAICLTTKSPAHHRALFLSEPLFTYGARRARRETAPASAVQVLV